MTSKASKVEFHPSRSFIFLNNGTIGEIDNLKDESNFSIKKQTTRRDQMRLIVNRDTADSIKKFISYAPTSVKINSANSFDIRAHTEISSMRNSSIKRSDLSSTKSIDIRKWK